MKKTIWIIACTIISLFLVLVIGHFIARLSNRETIIENKNLEKYTDIQVLINNTYNDKDKIAFEIPKVGSTNDYNTYYGVKSLLITDGVNTYDIIKYADNEIKNTIKHSEKGVFEGIERIYFIQKLLDDCNIEYKIDSIFELVEEVITNNYCSKGYFIYDELELYIKNMTEKEEKTTRLCHLMMTLYLCKRYELIEQVNSIDILKYIEECLDHERNIINVYYAELCFEYLGVQTKDISEDLLQMEIKKKNNLIEMNAYVMLCNRFCVNIEDNVKDHIITYASIYIKESKMSKLMELFYAIDTLDKLEEDFSHEKERITSLLKMYQNIDGVFSNITEYVIDNKQLLMHYTIGKKMGMKMDLQDYNNLILKDFLNMDSYDLFAYSYFVNELSLDDRDIRGELVQALNQCSLDNKSSVGYLLLALDMVEVNVKKENDKKNYIDEDIIKYVDILLSSNSIEYDTLDLILLYGIFKSGFKQINNEIIEKVKKVDVEKIDDVQAIAFYYKTKILLLGEKNLNKDLITKKEMLDYIEEYRCNGGFKMNKKDDCFDIQATYYFVDLL